MTDQTTSRRAPIFAFAMMMALLAAFLFKGLATNPPSVAATKAVTGFDGERAFARLARILGDETPHPVDSAPNDAVRERLLVEITALGYRPEVRDDFSCRGAKRWGGMSCARVRNVVFRTGPAGGNGVMIMAHYDSVPAAPGAGDDGAGVSAALEIAELIKSRTLTKPVLFVLTDGEEAGLLGAASFVRKDPWRGDAELVINLEARGTGGPAIMFQTNMPNGREIAALTSGPQRTVANSLAADIYRTLPNDTDATLLLEAKRDVLNFAFISPLARYHSSQDNLANLDKSSVAHMGAAALRAIDGHMAAKVSGEAEGQVIYSDIVGRGMLVLPMTAGWVLLGFGFVAAGLAYVRSEKGGAVRGLLAPLVAIAAAGGIGFGLLFAINLARSEPVWWWVSPIFARGVVYGSAVLGAGLALWMCRGISGNRLVAGGWLWLSGLFLGLAFVAPGAMILVAPAAGLFGLCVLIQQIWKGAAFLHVTWIAALILLIFPTLDFAEAGLGFGMGWGFGALAGLISFVILASAFSANWIGWKPLTVMALITAASTLCAWLAPAYSPKIPRPLNVSHMHEDGSNKWLISPGNEPAPAAMQAIAPFTLGPLTGSDDKRMIAKAPGQTTSPTSPSVQVLSEIVTGQTRTMVVRVISPDAEEVSITIPKGAKVTAMGNGVAGESEMFTYDPDTTKGARCVGRSCVSWDLKIVLGTAKTDWIVSALRRGQGPEGAALVKARPPWAAPNQGGDKRVSVRVQGL
jgi:Peptidase family M28